MKDDRNDFPPMKGSCYQDSCFIVAPDGEILRGRAGRLKANWYINKGCGIQVKENPFTVRLVPPLKGDWNNSSSEKHPSNLTCYLVAPDGEILRTLGRKNADWYLSRDLAKQVKEDPFTIQLKSEPKWRPVGVCDKYYQTPKIIRCVVCGQTESCVRKNVVPKEYRKHLPNILKSHQSHDVLWLCVTCHKISNNCDQALRKRLADECRAPTGAIDKVKATKDPLLKKVVSAARTIKSAKDRIPFDRLAELEAIITEYYNVSLLTSEVLEEALKIGTQSLNKEPHGRKVVSCYVQKPEGLLSLEILWRKHFIDSMKPEFLPPYWSLDHNKERLDNRMAQNRVDREDYVKAVGRGEAV
ncbi:exonuclease 3'-5' domain-containing protein 2-like [Artemia franciscana]